MAKTCGCRSTTPGNEGTIVGTYCQMHAAAPEMLTLLRGFVHAGEGWALESLRKDTRALLARIDGGAR